MPDYKEFEPQTDENILARCSSLAQVQVSLMGEVDEKELALADAKARLRQVQEFDLPAAMEEARQKKLTTLDGLNIELKEELRCSIPEHRKPAAFDWLRKHGLGRVIKNQYQIIFDKNQTETVKQFEAYLEEHSGCFDYRVDESVHPQTLKATVKEQLEKGVDLPLETFGVFRQTYAKVGAVK